MYTRRGDKGETSLYGPRRVAKDSPRVEAYGTLDELNSYLGVVISNCKDKSVAESLRLVQGWIFVASADMATERTQGGKVPRIGRSETLALEEMTDALLARLPKLANFILPGGTQLASELHFARTLCRRAERRAVTLSKGEEINPELLPFLNRLSSYFFNLARAANARSHRKEDVWKS